MAKRKTKKQVAKQEPKLTTNSIGYSGIVKVSIKNSKKVVSSFTSHNAGAGPLFRFLAKCLQGNYSEAEVIRPVKVKLFNNTNELSIVKADPTKVTGDGVHAASDFIYYNTTATIDPEKDSSGNIVGYLATLHFKIPFAYLKTSQQTFNQLCLYGSEAINDGDFSASYFITNAEGTDWNNIDTAEFGNNYQLIVEWTMRLTNQTESN